MAYCTPFCKKWTTFAVTGVVLILGVLLITCWKGFVKGIMDKELSLGSRSTKGFEMWQETPIPMYLEFHLFNWTNAAEVMKDPNIKPNFVECGPFVYHEHHIRENITIHDNDTVTFMQRRIWRYVPEKSVGSLDDYITTFNPIVATVANLVKDKHIIVRKGVNFFLVEKKVKLAITKKVREYLFEGYDDPLLDLVHKLNITGMNVPYTKFGWFVDRNNSLEYDGIFNMYNGANDIEALGRLHTWNYQTDVPYWPDSCGNVNGTTGELWYPPLGSETVKLFATDLCSSVELVKKDKFWLYGMESDKYVGTEEVFDNGSVHPEQKCFVPDHVQQPSGVRNVSLCKFGAPAFLSYAHFYLADDSYRSSIDGMQPNKSKHEMFIALEPHTGFPLRVQASFQVNLKLLNVKGITMLENMKPNMMPAFWFSQTAQMTDELVGLAKILLVLPSAGVYTGYGLVSIGILLGLIGCTITYRKGWRESEEESLLNQNTL
nr:unnamed protein product [Callosobruchus chinensis]